MREKVVIAGSGPAGWTAALYAARGGLAPLVIEGLQPGGQLTTTTDVENYPGFPESVEGTDLVERMKKQAMRFGARVRGGEVTGADFTPGRLRLTVSEEDVVEAAAVVVATGASALYLDVPSVRALIGRGVSACATCDGAFYRNVPVGVVGGGDSAMEEAMFLSRLASKVTLIHRRDGFRASRIMGERLLANAKIEVRWNSVVEEALDVSKGEVTGVRLRDVKTGALTEVPLAGLFMAIGHKPNTDPFRGQIELDEKGFVVARHSRTSVEGVFAAGDVQDPTYKQAVTAAGSGCMAALEVERFLSARAL